MSENTKPCFCCGQPAKLEFGALFFDHEALFREWSCKNQIISDNRSRFDGVRARLKYAALDENEDGAHATCALKWAVECEGFGTRYPADGVHL